MAYRSTIATVTAAALYAALSSASATTVPQMPNRNSDEGLGNPAGQKSLSPEDLRVDLLGRAAADVAPSGHPVKVADCPNVNCRSCN